MSDAKTWVWAQLANWDFSFGRAMFWVLLASFALALVAAVLLSAVVLVGLFQQTGQVVASRAVRLLSVFWVLQNLALISSVLLRLKLYVNAYQLSELRVYVGFFLVLVSTGFGLLAWRILRGKGLNWLLFSNACAAFGLFFVVQYLDVAGWVANYNVALWQKDTQRTLDVEYLKNLGPSAYPALAVVAGAVSRPEARAARERLLDLKALELGRAREWNWRSYQARHECYARWIMEWERGSAR